MQFSTRLALPRHGFLLDRSGSAWILIGIVISIGQGCSVTSNAPHQLGATTTVLVPAKPSVEQLQPDTPPIEAPSPLPRVSPETPPPEPEISLPTSPPPNFVETGLASWYGAKHHGKRTANGEFFNQNKFTAAHPSLPLGSIVKVTNLANGKSVDLRVNDRGPYGRGRIIDVSRAAATVLGMGASGVVRVRVELISPPEALGDLTRRK
jgi:rare lipoprotein A